MNKSTILLITGGIVVAGATVYGIYKILKNKDDLADKGQEAAPAVSNSKADDMYSSSAASAFEKTQAEIVSSIKDRHVTTAQQMKTTLNEMVTDCAEFDEKIAHANDDLDELLK